MSLSERFKNTFNKKAAESQAEPGTNGNHHPDEPLPRMKRFVLERTEGRPITVLYRGKINPDVSDKTHINPGYN